MSIVLVSDIFGVTPALLEMAKKLGASSIIDPYEGEIMGFKTEDDAYSYFVRAVGFDGYLSILIKQVETIKSEVTLIGFSVGASAVWRLSETVSGKFIKQAFCYYGSQIRNFTLIEPCFKINLVIPASEPHFDVIDLQATLSIKNNVKIIKSQYFHGFMNFHSNNYNECGYKEHLKILCSAAC